MTTQILHFQTYTAEIGRYWLLSFPEFRKCGSCTLATALWRSPHPTPKLNNYVLIHHRPPPPLLSVTVDLFLILYVPIYAQLTYNSDCKTVIFALSNIWRKARSHGIWFSAMAKNVRSHVLYFNIFSKILHKCYSISIIMIDFVWIFKKIWIFS